MSNPPGKKRLDGFNSFLMSGIVFTFHLLQFLQVKPGIFGWPQFLQAVTCERGVALNEARRLP